jgi:methyl-accepting chemotaxis protein
MDQGTQQNAAMVEQSTAASHGLAQQAAALNTLLQQFELGELGRSPVAVTTSGHRPAQSPARALSRKISAAFNGSAALQQEAEWTEF